MRTLSYKKGVNLALLGALRTFKLVRVRFEEVCAKNDRDAHQQVGVEGLFLENFVNVDAGICQLRRKPYHRIATLL